MLNAPITIFNNIIRTATMPEVEEDLELLTFIRTEVVNMKSNLRTGY
jgi:hypothetical protein